MYCILKIKHYRTEYLKPMLKLTWSGKPGSNRRPQPWQGCALPTELFPQMASRRGVEPLLPP